MSTISRKMTVVGSSMLLTAVALVQPSVAEPQYPPTIQTPIVGEQIIVAIAPKTAVSVVAIPKATSETIPLISESSSITLAESKIRPNTTLIAPTKPVEITSTLILGGVAKNELAQVPTAQVSSKKSTEVQVPSDVPTRISVTALPKSTTAVVRIVIGSRTVTLGNLRTDSNGKIILPPLTFTEKSKSVTVSVVAGGKTSKFTLRSTK